MLRRGQDDGIIKINTYNYNDDHIIVIIITAMRSVTYTLVVTVCQGM